MGVHCDTCTCGEPAPRCTGCRKKWPLVLNAAKQLVCYGCSRPANECLCK